MLPIAPSDLKERVGVSICPSPGSLCTYLDAVRLELQSLLVR